MNMRLLMPAATPAAVTGWTEVAVEEAMTNRSWSRKIWIVAARLMDLEYLTRSVQKGHEQQELAALM